MTTKTGQAWDELARTDPLWAILSKRGMRGGRWPVEEFFRTGEEELEGVLAEARRLDRPRRYGSALDFGCGVGRVTRAMASRFEDCVGVDISPTMVEHARRLNSDLSNCEFRLAEGLGDVPDASFDFVYAGFVLQHLPGDAIAGTIGELLRVLHVDGLAVVQLPPPLPLRNRPQLRRRLYSGGRAAGLPARLLIDVLRLHPISMTGFAAEEVAAIVEAGGGEIVSRVIVDATSAISGFRYLIARR